ncbi:NifU-like protein 2, chloroplastic [Capsicum annuum]|nr:NifU-like protein 2, chloroplastic [Capsicum annuum]
MELINKKTHDSEQPNMTGAVVSPSCVLPLTEENVEKVLEQVRPGLIADGGNVVLHEMDGLVVILKLQGALEQIHDSETGLELNEENIKKLLGEIRPYLVGAGGGELELVQIINYIVKVRLNGLAASVMTLCVALTQKFRDAVPTIVAVQLTD